MYYNCSTAPWMKMGYGYEPAASNRTTMGTGNYQATDWDRSIHWSTADMDEKHDRISYGYSSMMGETRHSFGQADAYYSELNLPPWSSTSMASPRYESICEPAPWAFGSSCVSSDPSGMIGDHREQIAQLSPASTYGSARHSSAFSFTFPSDPSRSPSPLIDFGTGSSSPPLVDASPILSLAEQLAQVMIGSDTLPKNKVEMKQSMMPPKEKDQMGRRGHSSSGSESLDSGVDSSASNLHSSPGGRSGVHSRAIQSNQKGIYDDEDVFEGMQRDLQLARESDRQTKKPVPKNLKCRLCRKVGEHWLEDCPEYLCHNCKGAAGRHWVGDCPLKYPKEIASTPYQGKKECIGKFQCPKCKRQWTLMRSRSNEAAECNKCNILVNPKKQMSPEIARQIQLDLQKADEERRAREERSMVPAPFGFFYAHRM